MATKDPVEQPTPSADADESVFDAITAQIISVFDRILKEVEARRDQLLSEVDKKKREIELKNSPLIKNVREMEKMRSQLENTTIEHNIALEQKQDSIDGFNTKIEEVRIEIYKNTQLKYSCSLDQLIQQIKQFGEIIDQAGNIALAKTKYSNLLIPLKTIDIDTSFRKILFGPGIKLLIDPHKEFLYATCPQRNDIMVIDANDFSFITSFGNTKYPPKCIASSKDYIYIGSTNKKLLLRYNSTNLSLLNVIQQSDTVCAIAVSEEDNVIALDINGRISIYDITLNLRVQIYSGFTRKLLVSTPIMVTRNNKIFILYDEKLTLHESLIDWSTDSFYFKDSKGNNKPLYSHHFNFSF